MSQFEDLIKGAMARMSEERKVAASNITLGDLISALKAAPQHLPCVVANGGGYVDCAASYRGYYEDLAFGTTDEPRTVADVLKASQEARGAIHQGYKGGDFPMHDGTLLWLSEWGRASEVMIVGTMLTDAALMFTTAHEDES